MDSQISVWFVYTVFKCRFVRDLSSLKLLKVLSQNKIEMLLLVIDGNCLIIDCGLLDFECVYRGVS